MRAFRHAYQVALAATFAFSLWLRSGFRMTAIGNASHDDLLFLQTAVQLGDLNWLGPYSELTLAKGAAFSAFAWLNHLAGLPLKLTEHAAYLGTSLLFASVLGKLLASRAATFTCFVFLAFNPTFWLGAVGGRVVRENLYLTLSLLVLALGARIFLVARDQEVGTAPREPRVWLVAFGLAGAAFWLTREEGLWLVPSVAILVGYWIARQAWGRANWTRERLRSIAQVLGICLASFLVVVLAVDSANWLAYGVFRNNDFRSADFQGAYGALSRIEHDRWERKVVFPKDARERAYAVSPAARELRPYLDGPIGEAWRGVSCEQSGLTGCPEILSGWFMWALRQSVTAAGHYRSATDAQAFYRRLADEINEACDRKAIPCRAARATMIPPWHPSYVADTLASARKVYAMLVRLGGQDPVAYPSIGTPEQIAFFSRYTRSRPATDEWKGPTGARQAIATRVARAERLVMPVLFPASIALWLVLLAGSFLRRTLDPAHGLAAALLAAVAMRVALLSFLDATSMPSANILYLSPAVPEMLAFVPCVAFLALRRWREAFARRAPAPAA